MSEHVWTTPPNTPERIKEIDEWMAREARVAADELLKTLNESREQLRALRKRLMKGEWPE